MVVSLNMSTSSSSAPVMSSVSQILQTLKLSQPTASRSQPSAAFLRGLFALATIDESALTENGKNVSLVDSLISDPPLLPMLALILSDTTNNRSYAPPANVDNQFEFTERSLCVYVIGRLSALSPIFKRDAATPHMLDLIVEVARQTNCI